MPGRTAPHIVRTASPAAGLTGPGDHRRVLVPLVPDVGQKHVTVAAAQQPDLWDVRRTRRRLVGRQVGGGVVVVEGDHELVWREQLHELLHL